tara:strand:- start:632 stop:1099 length:468 start_codon:yes stop_codon:yes gene_type:complete
MTQEVKRPARLDIVDMPRDTTRSLGGLRQALCASFNYCRKYPLKMRVLKAVLKYTYNRIVQWEKDNLAEIEGNAKNVLEAKALANGFDLDSRMTVENMEQAFVQGMADKAEALQAIADAVVNEPTQLSLPTVDVAPVDDTEGSDQVATTTETTTV